MSYICGVLSWRIWGVIPDAASACHKTILSQRAELLPLQILFAHISSCARTPCWGKIHWCLFHIMRTLWAAVYALRTMEWGSLRISSGTWVKSWEWVAVVLSYGTLYVYYISSFWFSSNVFAGSLVKEEQR